jgi:integrase
MRGYLTPALVKNVKCPAGKPLEIYWDGDGPKAVTGLGWKIMASGVGSYVCQYHRDGKYSRLTLGGAVRLADARKWAKGILGDAAKGHDPAEERRKARAAAKAQIANTMEAIAEAYLAIEGPKLRRNTFRQQQAIIRNVIVSRLGHLAVEDVRRRDISRVCDEVEAASGPMAGDKAFAVMGKLLRWYAARSDDYVPPLVRGMRKKTKSERSRILGDNEIRAVVQASENRGDVFGRYVMFLLLTAQRPDDAGHMTWEEIASGTWVIPASRYKTGTDHAVPLTAAARRLIDAAPHRTGFVFSNNAGKTAIGGLSRLKTALDTAAGVSGWVLHDIRRTSRSLLGRAGIPREICERVVGHKVGSAVERVYDRHNYTNEKLRALEALAALIEGIVNPKDNVVALRA